MLTVSPPELAFRSDVVARHGLPCFPDGNMAYRWPPTVGRPHPILYASANGQMARLDIPTVAQLCPPARGLPPEFRYAAGGGAIITNPLDGRWVGVAHLERAAPLSPNFFWGNLALFTSRDYGQTWNFLGVFVEPCVPYSDPLPTVCEIGGGSVCWVGEYLYCYFRETGTDGRGRAGMAYAKAYDVFAAAKAGQVFPWRKWSGGAIPNYFDPPALGGGLAEQLPGLPAEADWTSAVYLADRGYYLQAVCPFAEKRISLFTSPDGLTWTRLPGGPVTTDPGFHYYPTLVGLNPDERFCLADPFLWLYDLVTATDPFSWATAEVRRRRLVLN